MASAPLIWAPPVLSTPSRTPPSSLLPARQAPRVLIVDTDVARRAMHRAALAQEAWDIVEAPWEDGLVRTVEQVEPDVVLLSVRLADRAGLDACRDMRAMPAFKSVPIVLVPDGPADEDSIARGLLAGADDFVAGPGRLLELRARVRAQVRNKRERDALSTVRVERDHLRREAQVDPLTCAPNRRAIESVIRRHMATGDAFALLFFDVDHFKRVNDEFGHNTGDAVLCAVADRLTRGVRGTDVCGRWGGEEFVVVAAGIGAELAERVAERHRAAIEAIETGPLGLNRRVTVSVGVAMYDPVESDEDPTALVQRADEALYEAKRAGRNRTVVASRPGAAPAAPTEASSPSSSVVITHDRLGEGVPNYPRGAEIREPRSALERELVRQLAEGESGVPILPDVAAEALQLASSPTGDVLRLAKIIERSPAIAARFVALANSALYARGTRLTSTHATIVRIGLVASRDLVFQVACEPSITDMLRYQDPVMRSFRRSVLSGIAARTVSWELEEQLDHAYLCGLLHDIGEARVYRILSAYAVPPEGMETVRELVELYHPQAGADIAVAWGLPPDIVEACARHHEADPGTSVPLRITMLADALVDAAELESAPDAVRAAAARIARLGIADSRIAQLVETLRDAGAML